MPAPERTTLDAIVGAGSEILEAEGLDGLTMQAVAQHVGVRAPSLYKRVRDRDELVRLVATATTAELETRLRSAGSGLGAAAHAFRAFAKQHPQGFQLIISAKPDPAALARASEPVLTLSRELAGDEHALEAARLITAWVIGFLTMELAGAFQLGGSLDDAFEYGLRRLEAAVTS